MRRVLFILLIICASGVSAAGEMATKKVLGGKVELLMPNDMRPMPEAIRILKFPYLDENSDVYGDYDCAVSFSFEYTHVGRYTDESKLLAIGLAEIQRTGIVEIFESGIETINYRKFIFVIFQSEAVDMKMYNFMKSTVIGDKLLTCSFSCPAKDRDKWAAICRESLDSVNILRR